MKKILYLLVMISVALEGNAQVEANTKFKPIPAKNTKIKEVIPPKEMAPQVNPPAVVEKPAPAQFDPEELFKDRNLYKKESNSEGVFYNRNQFLGSFVTNSFTSTIRYRDAAFVDGDKIRVYLNDKVVEPQVSLDSDFQGFKIDLVPGINKIDFEALNEGFAAPNTAEFQVYDDAGKVISADQWNVGTGYKATIILIKE